MGKLTENLLITVVGGVAVMAIWSAIQRKASAAKTSGAVLSPNRGVTGLSNSGVYQYQDKAGLIDLGDTSGREYYV